jgi:hypothetical protein
MVATSHILTICTVFLLVVIYQIELALLPRISLDANCGTLVARMSNHNDMYVTTGKVQEYSVSGGIVVTAPKLSIRGSRFLPCDLFLNTVDLEPE